MLVAAQEATLDGDDESGGARGLGGGGNVVFAVAGVRNSREFHVQL